MPVARGAWCLPGLQQAQRAGQVRRRDGQISSRRAQLLPRRTRERGWLACAWRSARARPRIRVDVQSIRGSSFAQIT